MVFSAAGMFGCWVVSVKLYHIDRGIFYANVRSFVEPQDIISGLVKAAVFGVVFSALSTYKGYYASGGAKGVGVAGTQAVVFSFVSIFFFDYILTSLLQTT
jgi:phospholipid/cholesterol/gamma-HCH transport system permease protein